MAMTSDDAAADTRHGRWLRGLHPLPPLPILIGLLIVAYLSYLKGYNAGVQVWGEPYWVIDYSQGLIKRALAGQVLNSLMPGDFAANLAQHWKSVLAVHFLFAMILLAAMVLWVRETAPDKLVFGALALFCTSQFLPTLAYNTGYLDVYLYVFLLFACMSVAYGKYLPAIILGFAGPFIHESFIFIWGTLVVLVAAERWTRDRRIEKIALLASPVLATLIVYLFHSEAGAISLMEASPLSDEIKQGMIQIQFGQTITSSFIVMLGIYRANPDHMLFSGIFFTLPATAIVVLYAYGRELDMRRTLAMLLAALAPLSILIFAWDLSRFLVAATLTALIAALYAETRWSPVRKRAAPLVWLAAPLCVAYGLLPFVYAYFDFAAVINEGVFPPPGNPIEVGVRAFFERYY